MKRNYQRFLHERNRGRKDCDGRPDREADEIVHWANEHNLPYEEDGHVHSRTRASSTRTEGKRAQQFDHVFVRRDSQPIAVLQQENLFP